MQHPLILISSSRVMGNLSISRQQSALYGACSAKRWRGGRIVYRWPIRLALPPAATGCCSPAAVTSILPVSQASKTLRFRLIRCVTRRSGHSSRTFYRRCKPIRYLPRRPGDQRLLGGTLHQDICGSGGCHGTAVPARFSHLVGPAPTVNSYHHWRSDQPAPCSKPAARASDGIIGGVAHATAPILGVQWHPERMVPPFCEDVAGANHLPLFHWLIELLTA